MILFKGCPHCGGDVDASYKEDVYCVQCSYRPDVSVTGPRVEGKPMVPHLPVAAGRGAGIQRDEDQTKGEGDLTVTAAGTGRAPCPRCESLDLILLDRLRRKAHYCYRLSPLRTYLQPQHGS